MLSLSLEIPGSECRKWSRVLLRFPSTVKGQAINLPGETMTWLTSLSSSTTCWTQGQVMKEEWGGLQPRHRC